MNQKSKLDKIVEEVLNEAAGTDPRFTVKGAAVKNYMDVNRDGPRRGRPPLKKELPRTKGTGRVLSTPGGSLDIVVYDNYTVVSYAGNMGTRTKDVGAIIDKRYGAGTWSKLESNKVFEWGSPSYSWFIYSEYILAPQKLHEARGRTATHWVEYDYRGKTEKTIKMPELDAFRWARDMSARDRGVHYRIFRSFGGNPRAMAASFLDGSDDGSDVG